MFIIIDTQNESTYKKKKIHKKGYKKRGDRREYGKTHETLLFFSNDIDNNFPDRHWVNMIPLSNFLGPEII